MKKRITAILVTAIMIFSVMGLVVTTEVEAATLKLNKTKVTVCINNTAKLKVLNSKKTVKWSSSNKKIATVSGNGLIKGKKPGTATITAKTNGKVLKCKVTIKKHNYSKKYTVDSKATCIKKGSKSRHCTRYGCKTKTGIKTIKKTAHKYTSWEIIKAATCGSNGSKVSSCNCCGKEITSTIAALGHNYKYYTVDKMPTIETEGIQSKYCTKCNFKTDTKTMAYSELEKDHFFLADLGDGNYATVLGHFELDMADEIFDLTNKYRNANGKDSYKKGHVLLQEAADIRGYELGYSYSHTRPNGVSALESFFETNFDIRANAENIAMGFPSSKDVTEAWIDSPGHNRNILNDYSDYLSVSVFALKNKSDFDYTLKYVQLFGVESWY